MASERNYFITTHHQAGVHFENSTDVKFRDSRLTGTGHRERRLNRDSPGQNGTYGRSTTGPYRVPNIIFKKKLQYCTSE